MGRAYKILYQGGVGEVIEKKSRFIATTIPVQSEGEARGELEAIRKKYWDASHNCYAYVIGEQGSNQKCSDDGEPSGTAGKPILEVLLGEGVKDALIVVTRYFGGTLLGTGGLVKAYTQAAQEGLENSGVVVKSLARKLRIGTDYAGIGKIKHLTDRLGVDVMEVRYSEKVEFDVLVLVDEVEGFCEKVRESTAAQAQIEDEGTTWYGKRDGVRILWDDA